MKIPAKKSKADKSKEFEKLQKDLSANNMIAFIEMADIQHRDLDRLRQSVDGKIKFIKKKRFERYFKSKKQFLTSYYLFLTKDLNEIEKLNIFRYLDYAKAGEKCTVDVKLPAGVVRNQKVIEYIKNEEMTTEGSKIILKNEFFIAKEGDILTQNQEKALKILGTRMVERGLNILFWGPIDEVLTFPGSEKNSQ